MKFTSTTVEGAFVVEPEPCEDARGLFARLWDQEEFRARGLAADFVQCNDSFSHKRGTLRGLHYQAAPHGEVKLMRCVRGAIFDVALDVRAGSATFGRWVGLELSAENRRMLYVPAGCAHGYLTLADETEVIYPVSAAYHPECERGVRWNDPRFAIAWPEVGALSLSDKDQRWPDWA